ncbi:MAG: tRNA-Thr(GGU) m(6)t(6)A37 methyltransferase TsaA [Bradymonadia bacterium]|jgi:tRNA-Thr(GGU) m(6)t(6)A37 methyltransferase TsaA
MSEPSLVTFAPIGLVRSPYIDLFGTPRQAGLVDAPATIELAPVWRPGLEGLAGFSHVWVIWIFDRNKAPGRARVRPPRLGGAEKIGVFATRSPYRPNPIGLSVARIEEVTEGGLRVRGLDVADGTPVLDLKPYLPYADAHPDASAGWADGALPDMPVRFDPATASTLALRPELRAVIEQCFRLDPRPARHRHNGARRSYAVRLWDVDVRAEIDETGWCVVSIEGVAG